ncbi:tyrosine phosphatase family-domain-containing protein [Glomus cerebriforme]|uniref:Tyrosine phosphatase family-domain-containing protein n=1 Tax=Glomus cerebriforme TaxID=658196 RepID=A0A397T4K5_9GLOM|nr:tyrosine phosphatase family-domain-containing protein [Glomus cerebriforme]
MNQSTIQLIIKNNLGQNIVGILEIKSSKNTLGEKLGIICHGIIGHKDYLFQAKLAKELPFDNFRFDFRGNGKSDGILKFSNFQEDVEDINTVVKYLENEYGYKLYTLIGHSKGSCAVLKYACHISRNIPHVINISARYYMPAVLSRFDKPVFDSLNEQGYFYWEYKIRDEIARMKVTKEDLDNFINYDMSFVRTMPETTSVLTCHGIADEVVPVKDAAFYANLIPNHTLKLIPGANHNYNRKHKELIEIINKYFSNEFQSMKFNEKYLYINGVPRYILIDGVKNFRDLGGYQCNLGKREENKIQKFIRERFIFRGGSLSSITDDGIVTLRKLNIQKIFDLRSNPEIDKFGVKNIEGMVRVHAPVFKEDAFAPEALFERWGLYTKGVEGYSQAYMVILEEGKKAFYEIFKHILEYPTQPFIVHCTAGKDRTGVFAMLLLKLLGVNDEIISREYELTHVNTEIKDPKEIKMYVELTNNYYNENQIKEMFSARYEFMESLLRKFQNHYKSVDNYLLQCGFTTKEIENIKNNLMISNNIKNLIMYQNNNVIKSLL